MADNFAVVSSVVPADIPLDGTFDVPYPAGTDATSFNEGAPDQVILIINDSDRYQGPDHVTVAYGAAITVTNTHDTEIWRAGSSALLQVPKTPVFQDAEASADKIAAVIGAGMGIAPLAGNVDPAVISAKVDELIAAYAAT